jgi:uncharacterized protein YfiM (DUF2279 family)
MKIDKLYHLIAGIVIAAAAGWFFTPEIGLAAGVLAGAGKEAWDHIDYGGANWPDFVATLLGAGAGAALVSAI